MKINDEYLLVYYCCCCESWGAIGSYKPIKNLSCYKCSDIGQEKDSNKPIIDLETGLILDGRDKGKLYDKFEELKPKAKIIFKKLGLC